MTIPHSEALFEKSCLRCHPTHSYHRMGSSGVEQLFNPPRDIPHPCVHMPACPPHFLRSSAWNQRMRETPCSDVARIYDGALTARHSCHGGRFAFRRGPLCTARAGDAFLHDILFYTLAFLVFIPPASRIEYIFGRRSTYSAIARPAHSSFNFPRTVLLAELYRGWS